MERRSPPAESSSAATDIGAEEDDGARRGECVGPGSAAVAVATSTLTVAAAMPPNCDPTAPCKRILFIFFLSPTHQMLFD